MPCFHLGCERSIENPDQWWQHQANVHEHIECYNLNELQSARGIVEFVWTSGLREAMKYILSDIIHEPMHFSKKLALDQMKVTYLGEKTIKDKLDVLHQISTRIGWEMYEARCQNKNVHNSYVQFLLKNELSKGNQLELESKVIEEKNNTQMKGSQTSKSRISNQNKMNSKKDVIETNQKLKKQVSTNSLTYGSTLNGTLALKIESNVVNFPNNNENIIKNDDKKMNNGKYIRNTENKEKETNITKKMNVKKEMEEKKIYETNKLKSSQNLKEINKLSRLSVSDRIKLAQERRKNLPSVHEQRKKRESVSLLPIKNNFHKKNDKIKQVSIITTTTITTSLPPIQIITNTPPKKIELSEIFPKSTEIDKYYSDVQGTKKNDHIKKTNNHNKLSIDDRIKLAKERKKNVDLRSLRSKDSLSNPLQRNQMHNQKKIDPSKQIRYEESISLRKTNTVSTIDLNSYDSNILKTENSFRSGSNLNGNEDNNRTNTPNNKVTNVPSKAQLSSNEKLELARKRREEALDEKRKRIHEPMTPLSKKNDTSSLSYKSPLSCNFSSKISATHNQNFNSPDDNNGSNNSVGLSPGIQPNKENQKKEIVRKRIIDYNNLTNEQEEELKLILGSRYPQVKKTQAK